MNILITSVGTATSVNLIKYFKKIGDSVIGTDINDYGMTSGSMLVNKFYKVPIASDFNFIKRIEEIIAEEKIEIFIPINDIEVFTIAKQIGRIKCKCLIPDYETINILRDKLICSRQLEKYDINVPGILKDDNCNLRRILRDRVGVGSKGIDFIEHGYKCPEYNENRFLQECIQGREFTVDVMADSTGRPLYIVPRERLEVKSGVATKVRIVNDEKLIETCIKILRVFKLPGFSNIQFIKDGDGKCWFIEINYRFSGCGAATLATSKKYLEKYKMCAEDRIDNYILNEDTKWNAIVTRYYEEVVYEDSFS